MFGTQQLYKELRLLACIEIVENQSYYEPTNAACHPLLSRYDIVAPFVHELVRTLERTVAWSFDRVKLCTAGVYPKLLPTNQISCAFMSPLTVNIDGHSNSSIFFRYYSINNSMPWDFGKLVCIISTKSFIFILRCVMFIAYTQKTT